MRFRWPISPARLRATLAKGFAWTSLRFEGTRNKDDLVTHEVARTRRWPVLLFSLLFAVAVAAVLVFPDPYSAPLPSVAPGDIAETPLRSPISTDVEPRALPSKNKQDLFRKVAPVFDYDETAIPLWVQGWIQAISEVRRQFFSQEKPHGLPKPQVQERVAELIRQETGQTVSEADLTFLMNQRFSRKLEEALQELTKPLLGRLIAQNDLFPSYYSTGIIVRQIHLGLNETLITDVSRIWSLDHARQLINRVQTSESGANQITRQLASMVQYLVVPNLKFNAALTERRVNQALGRNDAGTIPVRKGQLLVRAGERVSDDQAEIIEALRGYSTRAVLIQRFTLLACVLTLFFYILFHLDLTRKSFLRLSLKNGLVFASAVLVTLVSIKLVLAPIQSLLLPWGISGGAQYLMPVTAGAIIIYLLLGRELAFTFGLVLGVCSGLLVDRGLFFGLWVLCVCTMAIQSIGACKLRSDLYRCGAISGLVAALLVMAFHWYQSFGLQSFNWWVFGLFGLGSFLAAMLGSIIASTLIPVLESVLGYTTNLKLLELSNFNHPLLHNLMMKAPGTYHHSIMVGSLAEIAADRIKANSLLARVSAYYHDIGKMGNPLYFIENQSPQYNPHDHLAPSISARILFSHVKNGARLGREHGLGDSINDVIQQHHGTTLTTFFYNKAKEIAKEGPAPAESDYRYPGPRPQSREAAIVMIADACEASTRSILDPTPAKIQSMVHSIINKRFLDQQFHDCDLTLKDLQVIEDSISRTLMSLYHHRIEYPGQNQALGDATQEFPRKSS